MDGYEDATRMDNVLNQKDKLFFMSSSSDPNYKARDRGSSSSSKSPEQRGWSKEMDKEKKVMLDEMRKEKKEKERKDRSKSEERICYRCGKSSHITRDCGEERKEGGSFRRGPSGDRRGSLGDRRGSSGDRRNKPGRLTPYNRSRSPSGDQSNPLVGHFGIED